MKTKTEEENKNLKAGTDSIVNPAFTDYATRTYTFKRIEPISGADYEPFTFNAIQRLSGALMLPYVGRTDKNGVNVAEGDILLICNTNHYEKCEFIYAGVIYDIDLCSFVLLSHGEKQYLLSDEEFRTNVVVFGDKFKNTGLWDFYCEKKLSKIDNAEKLKEQYERDYKRFFKKSNSINDISEYFVKYEKGSANYDN